MQQLVCDIEVRWGLGENSLRVAAAKAMHTSREAIGSTRLLQYSLDVRSRIPLYHCLIEVSRAGERPVPFTVAPFKTPLANAKTVIIVGAGPAGLFAALRLLQRGMRPVILERGKAVQERRKDVASLSRDQQLNPNSNYCFGEGGAGTFSDGKLFTRSTKRGNTDEILQLLVAHGADPMIVAQTHAHIGTDKLPAIIENIRETILKHGGSYHFNTCVTEIIVKDNRVSGVKDSEGCIWEAQAVILAAGHAAKEIYTNLAQYPGALEAKGFALGVRVEHEQELIDNIQYHKVHPSYRQYLPPATYSLVAQAGDCGVFSFCMCPGGVLVPAMTESNTVVLNGMSNSQRSGRWANAGLVVTVNPNPGTGPLDLLHWQEQVERDCFDFSGSFKAPAQRMTDFARNRLSMNLPETSYHMGTVSAPLHTLLPTRVVKPLQLALRQFDTKMRGYYTQEALLLGVESRTSSAVRILRNKETLEHVVIKGLYPCGEGAGYAGGIVSSAMDGMNAAQAIY